MLVYLHFTLLKSKHIPMVCLNLLLRLSYEAKFKSTFLQLNLNLNLNHIPRIRIYRRWLSSFGNLVHTLSVPEPLMSTISSLSRFSTRRISTFLPYKSIILLTYGCKTSSSSYKPQHHFFLQILQVPTTGCKKMLTKMRSLQMMSKQGRLATAIMTRIVGSRRGSEHIRLLQSPFRP